jgi:hypothetical protein
MTKNRAMPAAALAASILILGSCLSGETLHDLYIDPDARVTWTVTERDVRSTAGEAEGLHEERDWLEAVRAGDHPVARALRRAGARRVSTAVVRDDRPYTVVTTGTFDGLDEALGGLFEGLGVAHEIDLSRSPDGALRLDLAIRGSEEALPEHEGDDSVLALATDLEGYRFVLTSGAFVEAEGFTLEHDDTVARMIDRTPADGVERYRLAWRGGPR